MTDLVSAAYLDKLRNYHPHANSYNLSVILPETVFVGTVTSAPAFGDRTIYVNTVSGSLASIVAGYTAWVGTASENFTISKRRVRSVGADYIVFDENNVDWIAGQYITVKAVHEYWGIYPYNLTDAPYTFYKDRDIAYSDQNRLPPPVAIAGSYQVGFLDGSSITFNLNASSSYAIAQGATITSYLWECDEGVIASASSAATTITFIATGIYWVKLTVTDSNSKTQSTYRLIRVHDRASDPPYYNFKVTAPLAQEWDYGGWKTTIELQGGASLATYPEGAIVILWAQQYFQGTEYYLFDNIKIVGYFRRTASQATYDTGIVTFDIETLNGVMLNTPMYNVSLEWNYDADTWYRYRNLTSPRAVHHYWKYHSTLLEITDVFLPMEETTAIVACDDFEKGDMYGQVDNFMYNHSIFAHVMCDKHNRVRVCRDLHMLGDSEREAADTMWTLTTADTVPGVEISYNVEPTIGHIIVDGGVRDGVTGLMTPIISQAPGEVPNSKGAQETVLDRLVIASQAAGNVLAGRAYAVLNRRIDDITIKLAGAYHNVLEILPQRWLTAYAIENEKGENLAGRYTLKSISTEINVETGVETSTIVMIPDVTSTDGIPGPYPPEVEEGGGDPGDPNTQPPNPPEPPAPPSNTLFADIMVATDTDIRSSDNMAGVSVSWASKYAGITGTIVDACHMRGAQQSVVFVLTETKLYRTVDFLSDAPTWVLQVDLETWTDNEFPDGLETPIATRVIAGIGYTYVLGASEVNGELYNHLFVENILGWSRKLVYVRDDGVLPYTVDVIQKSMKLPEGGSGGLNPWANWYVTPIERKGTGLYQPYAIVMDITAKSEDCTYIIDYRAGEGVPVSDTTTLTYPDAAGGYFFLDTVGTKMALINSRFHFEFTTGDDEAVAFLDDYFGVGGYTIAEKTGARYCGLPNEPARTNVVMGIYANPATPEETIEGVLYIFWKEPRYLTTSAIDCGKHNKDKIYISFTDSTESKIIRSVDGGNTWEDYITDHGAYDIECHVAQSTLDDDITFISDEGRLYRTSGTSIGSSLYLELSPTEQHFRIASDPVEGWPIYMNANSGTGYVLVKRGENSTVLLDASYDPTEALGIKVVTGTTAATRRIYYLGNDDIRYAIDGETFESKKGDWSGYAGPVNISPLVE